MRPKELFYSTGYYVAYRNRTVDGILSDNKWMVLPSSKIEWYADPFLFELDGRHFIFAERMSVWRTRGTVSYCEIHDDGTVSNFKEVMVEPFHLSYPNVFEYCGSIYMIPETGHANDIRLYRSVRFPDQWELVTVLYSGANFVDTSFVSDIKDGCAILYSFDWDNKCSHFYRFNLDELSLSELPNNPGMMNERSGGNYFEQGGDKLRVMQDCSRTYGEKIIINRIGSDDYENGNASESFAFEIRPQDLILNTNRIYPINCHTYNQTAYYEVVDFLAERFVWFKPFLTLRRKIRSAYHKVFSRL